MYKSKANHSRLSFGCGAGAADVNVFTGGLSFSHHGMSVGANSFNISVGHVYNSRLNGNGLGLGFLDGWKLNCGQYIFPYESRYNFEGFSVTGTDGFGDYVYIDAAGEVHRFVYYKSVTESRVKKLCYYDESGTGLTLKVDTVYRTYEIADGSGSITLKLSLYNSSAGRLYAIEEKLSASVTVTKKVLAFEGGAYNIYDTRKASRKLKLNYDGEQLKTLSCTEPDSNGNRITLNHYYDKELTLSYRHRENKIKQPQKHLFCVN